MNVGFETYSDYYNRIIAFLEIEGIKLDISDDQIAEYYNRGVLFSDLIDIIIEEIENVNDE